MITFIKELLKTTRFLISMALVAAMLWLLAIAMFFSTISAYRVKASYNKGRDYFHQGNKQAAISELNHSLRLNPGLVGAYKLAGKTAFDTEDYEKAITYFERAMKYDDKSSELRAAVGVATIMRSFRPGFSLDRDGTDELYDLASESTGDGDVLVNLGSVALYQNAVDDAKRYYGEAVRTGWISRDGLVCLYNGLGVIHAKKARKATGARRRDLLSRAKVEFRKAELLDPKSASVALNRLMLDLALLADMPIDDPRRRDAVRRAENFYKQRGKEAGASLKYALHHNLGLEAYSQGKFEEAVRAFETALGMNMRSTADAFNRVVAGVALARQKPSDEFISTLRVEIERLASARSVSMSEIFPMLIELAAVEYTYSHIDDAQKHFEEVAKLIDDTIKPTDAATVYRALAILNYEEDRFRDTRQMIKRALQADPSMTDLNQINERLAKPPRVTFPVVLNKRYLPDNMPVIRAEVYNRSTSDPLGRDNIKVTIGKTEAIVGFTKHSQILAIPVRPLGEGVHAVVIKATDFLGNSAESKAEIVIDHTPPSVSVKPAPGSTLEPGVHTITVALKDKVTGVEYVTIGLKAILQPAEGRPRNITLIKDGRFEEGAGLDQAGVPIEEDKFSFELNDPLAPGKYRFTLRAADRANNKMRDYIWSYTVEAEGEE